MTDEPKKQSLQEQLTAELEGVSVNELVLLASEVLQQIETHPHMSAALCLLGTKLVEHGKHILALEYLEKGLLRLDYFIASNIPPERKKPERKSVGFRAATCQPNVSDQDRIKEYLKIYTESVNSWKECIQEAYCQSNYHTLTIIDQYVFPMAWESRPGSPFQETALDLILEGININTDQSTESLTAKRDILDNLFAKCGKAPRRILGEAEKLLTKIKEQLGQTPSIAGILRSIRTSHHPT